MQATTNLTTKPSKIANHYGCKTKTIFNQTNNFKFPNDLNTTWVEFGTTFKHLQVVKKNVEYPSLQPLPYSLYLQTIIDYGLIMWDQGWFTQGSKSQLLSLTRPLKYNLLGTHPCEVQSPMYKSQIPSIMQSPEGSLEYFYHHGNRRQFFFKFYSHG